MKNKMEINIFLNLILGGTVMFQPPNMNFPVIKLTTRAQNVSFTLIKTLKTWLKLRESQILKLACGCHSSDISTLTHLDIHKFTEANKHFLLLS